MVGKRSLVLLGLVILVTMGIAMLSANESNHIEFYHLNLIDTPQTYAIV